MRAVNEHQTSAQMRLAVRAHHIAHAKSTFGLLHHYAANASSRKALQHLVQPEQALSRAHMCGDQGWIKHDDSLQQARHPLKLRDQSRGNHWVVSLSRAIAPAAW